MLSAYEESLKNFWDLNNCLDSAERKGFEKGEAIGLEKGEAIGLEKRRGHWFGKRFAECCKTFETSRYVC